MQDALDQIAKKATSSAGQMDRAFGALKTTLATLGVGFSLAAMRSFVQNAIDASDHLNDLSKKTGVAVETLGGLGFAAQQSGSSLDSMADAFGKLNRSIAEAGAGNAEKAAAFRLLGVSVKDASGNMRSADEVFADLADRFANYEDGANKVALAVALFGKAGADIIPTLNEGGAKLRENVEYFKRYSGVSQETAERADQFNDTLAKLSLLSTAFGNKVASALLDPLQAIADHMVEAKEKSQLFEKSAEAMKTVFKGLSVFAAGYAATIQIVGNTFGAVLAMMERAQKLDFRGAATVFKELSIDNAKTLADLDKFVTRLNSVPSAEEIQDRQSGGITAIRNPRRQAPGLPDSGAKSKAEDLKKLYEEVSALGRSLDVEVPFIKDREALEKIKKTLTEGKKDWLAYADAVFAAADSQNSALASGESFTQYAEKARDKILDLVDPLRQVKKQNEEIDTLVATGWLSEMDARLAKLPAAVRDLLQPVKNIHDEIQTAYEQGLLTTEEMQSAAKRAFGDFDKLKDSSEDFGHAISTAFEDAVVQGKKFKDVLGGLLQTLAQIALRATVTKPLENALTDSLKGGGGFTGLLKGIFGTGGEFPEQLGFSAAQLASFDVGTDYVPRTGLALIHKGEAVIPASQNGSRGDVTVVQHINVDSRSDRASINQALAVARVQNLRAVEDARRRRVA